MNTPDPTDSNRSFRSYGTSAIRRLWKCGAYETFLARFGAVRRLVAGPEESRVNTTPWGSPSQVWPAAQDEHREHAFGPSARRSPLRAISLANQWLCFWSRNEVIYGL